MAPAVMPSPKNASGKADMTSVTQLVTGEDLSSKFNQIKNARHTLDVQWKLNLRYYQGSQYSYYNKTAKRIEELPSADGEKPRYRIRLKSNQIMPGAQTLLSKFLKTKPVITASPGSSDACDLRAAQMSERLLEFWWTDLNLDSKLEEVLLWAIIGGQGYWHICWDDKAGKPMTFTINPQTGAPITNEAEKKLFLEEIENAGVPRDAVQKTFYMGDVRVDVLTPWSVYLDPSEKSYDRCKYAFVVDHQDPDEVYARYGKWLQPDSIPTSEDQILPQQYGGAFDNTLKTTCRIITGYFRPTPVQPKGRVVTWAESTKEILADDPWPYPTHELPLIKFGMLKLPGSIYDSSVVEHAIPLQQELNRTISQIVEYKNLTIRPRVWAPVGSLRQRLTNEPGAAIEYTPIGGMKPEIEALPSMPPYVFEHLNNIASRLKEAFYTTEIDGGSLPPNIEAFTAIDLLQEMSTAAIAPAIKLMERSVARSGQQLLELAQELYVEPRLVAIKGSNGSEQVKEFSRADIVGGVTVAVETGSGLPRTRAGRQAQITQLMEQGLLSPQQALKRMDIADLRGPLAAIAADEDQALREHDKMISGTPINPDAVRQAIQAINTPDPQLGTPVNPDTGQPFASPEEMQKFVHDAGLEPLSYENYQAHVEQHGLYMKSREWEELPPEVQADFVTHFDKTYQILINLPIQGVKGPNVNLQIKSTMGPTATAEVLNRAGVYKVTPDQLMEPEMPSWISDDLTKDPGMAQNSPEAVAHAQQMEEQQWQLEAEQAQQQAEQSSQQHDVSQAQGLQSLTHAEEKHQQSMQHAHDAHQSKLEAAKQASKQKQVKPSGKA